MKKSVISRMSKKACAVCTKRKVKCDRQIPCGNCVRRGQESECIKAVTNDFIQAPSLGNDKDSFSNILRLWNSYEYWITDVGLFKTKNIDITAKIPSFEARLAECAFWTDYLQLEESFKLLNFAVENLGPLYFGCLGDISELFVQLESYWNRRQQFKESPNDIFFSIDDYYWNSLLWSIFSMCVYYSPLETIAETFKVQPICEQLGIDTNQQWSESLQLTLVQGFAKCSMHFLHLADNNRNPDVRFIQSFLILSTTNFQLTDYFLSDTLLSQSAHIARFFNIDSYKQLSTDDESTDLSKEVFSKIWMRMCMQDYQQENPNKKNSFHKEISSLLQHAAFYQDMPNFDIYKQEDSFESLCWKISSLERDLDKYLLTSFKPQIKTFDAIKRELAIFEKKIGDLNFDKKSTNSQFEKFISIFLLSTVQWKLHKMYLIYFNAADSLQLSVHYLQIMVRLIEKNMNRELTFFNKHPLIIRSLSRIVPFYAFYNIFESNPQIEELNNDLGNLILALPVLLGEKCVKLTYLVQRLNSMNIMWEKVRVEGSSSNWSHPVLKIIQDDIKIISRYSNRTLVLVKGVPSFGDVTDINSSDNAENDKEYFARNKESTEFKFIVNEFEKQHSISNIFD
ncbi:similar to Saccharomyces cerevisiae YMR168C CEP3 Essential kinetochore protein, component of the CBF3 complex that binds the CDEIII region of the centromere [Maudiozyma saulgeensis]|uniref:Similar to Saccharomyces cerevisiae YMR168C CEP3 Essential kinetochore protein, component of the CBF3 complex that binds the CDEIII region of the centromere n=1 Tax=Maudiozyma saulgeensis TaxID=1789683 RepID=A0A1X7R1U8_9SACH|nr:similar to Saccharomyces cerevisiae YMR168C CEP3 Essential kinetochore protein, component of the CBF3 complex that binds the CDEIII region of the centromere [Kazachstania saulgeensis]